MPEVVATPGVDRVVTFTINGHSFGFRRPSRADEGDAQKRYVMKVAESEMLAGLGGTNFFWESRLEVGLVPRRNRASQEINLGEKAPSHWFDDGVLSFDQVDPEEFKAVVEYLESEVFKKKTSEQPKGKSGSSAADSNNG